MKKEIYRQLVHLSGLLFVIVAQFTPLVVIVPYFFLVALFFLAYSIYIKRQVRSYNRMAESLEKRFRGFTMKFERAENFHDPFRGPFFFFLAFGLAFVIFPLAIASAACAMLAAGDSLSTLVGKRFGKTRLVGKKTVEGSLAFLAGSLIVSGFFVPFPIFIIGAVAAMFSELIPRIDDNLTVPLISGFVLWVLLFFF